MVKQITKITCDMCSNTEDSLDDAQEWFGLNVSLVLPVRSGVASQQMPNVAITRLSDVANGDLSDFAQHLCCTRCLGEGIEDRIQFLYYPPKEKTSKKKTKGNSKR